MRGMATELFEVADRPTCFIACEVDQREERSVGEKARRLEGSMTFGCALSDMIMVRWCQDKKSKIGHQHGWNQMEGGHPMIKQ